MAVEKDQTAWLPEPPPPRPARRDAAIAAALRRFDGTEEAAPVATGSPRPSWARAHRTQLGVAVSAVLLVVIGIPAALIGIRNQPQPVPETSPAPAIVVPDMAQQPAAPRPAESANAVQPPAAPANPAPARPAVQDNRVADAHVASKTEPVAEVPPALAVAAAPPPPAPPPPPPPPPPAPSAERDSVGAQELVVTGSAIRAPDVSAFQRRPARDTGRSTSGANAKAVAPGPAYAAFVSRLQAAVRANDRRAIIGLISFPLRVNARGQSRTYRDAAAVERDFDRIFTPQVKRAILAQNPRQLFVRDQGAMIGDGEVWFDQTCPNPACSPAGPVRIRAINP